MKGFFQCVIVLGEFSSSNDFAESSILGIPSSARHNLSLDQGLGARGGLEFYLMAASWLACQMPAEGNNHVMVL